MKNVNYTLVAFIMILSLLLASIVFTFKKEQNHKEACAAKDGVWLSRDWVCLNKSFVIQVQP